LEERANAGGFIAMRAIATRVFGALFLLLVSCAGCDDGDPIDAKTARAMVIDYLAEYGTEIGSKRPADYDLEAKLFTDSIWLVHAIFKKEMIGASSLFLVDRHGVRPATPQNLAVAHQQKFGASDSEDYHRKVIESIIHLHSSQGGRFPATLISNTSEIPGYDQIPTGATGARIGGPLDTDLEPVIRPLWKEEWPTSGYLFYVAYTYNPLGGTVSRYKFQFNATARDANGGFSRWKIYSAEHIVLGRMVGDYRALE
jgi:hypothetical protein